MRIAVIGLGRLGAPLAVLAAAKGHGMIAVDCSPVPVERLKHWLPPVDEPGLEQLLRGVEQTGGIMATTEMRHVATAELSLVVVPTPSAADGTFSSAFVVQAVFEIGKALASELRTTRHTVGVVSTLTPGSMDGPVREALELGALRRLGPELGLVYAPQLIALGSVLHDLKHPDLVLVGSSDMQAASIAEMFFDTIVEGSPAVLFMGLEEAEVTKLAINAYLTMKMSFANVLGEIAAARGLRAGVIAHAVGTDTRIGRKYLKPATAFGGPCFPRDSRAFAAYARNVGASAELAEATDVVNERQHVGMVQWVWGRLEEMSHRGTVGILGLTYKPGTSVTEASAGMAVADRLMNLGVPVLVHDPEAVMVTPYVRRIDSAQDLVDRSAIVVITTPWPEYADLKYEGKTVLDPWRIRR